MLAGLTEVESAHGCNMGPSSAGAIGWTQFMPATWKEWGMDASGDGKADPYNAVDAIYSSARYLRASGAPKSYYKALSPTTTPTGTSRRFWQRPRSTSSELRITALERVFSA